MARNTVGLGALALAGACLAVGCSSSSKSAGATAPPPDLTVVRTTGHVDLPPGVTMAGVQVKSLYGEGSVKGDDSFSLATLDRARSLAAAIGPGGEAVLLGFLKEGETTLDVHSTAAVLACQAIGVGLYLGAEQEAFVDALAASTTLGPLEDAVAAAIQARGEGWLDPTDTGLSSALAGVAAQYLATTSTAGAAATAAHAATRGPAATDSLRAPRPPGSTHGAIVTPTARVSGLQLVADGVGSAVVKNSFRRRAYLYVGRVSYKDQGGTSVEFPMDLEPRPIRIPPVKGLDAALKTVGTAILGNADYYDPVSTDPIAVPLVPPSTARSTTYQLSALGLARNVAGVSGLSAELRSGYWEVASTTLVLDVVVPVITNLVLPQYAKEIDKAAQFKGTTGMLRDVLGALSAQTDIRNKAESGDVAGAMSDSFKFIVSSGTFRNLILEFGLRVLEESGTSVDGYTPEWIRGATEKVVSYLTQVDVLFKGFDTAVQAWDLVSCNAVETWTLEVTSGQVRLNPSPAHVDRGYTVDLMASVIDAETDALFTYRWAAQPRYGVITDGIHPSPWAGGDSSSKTLTYQPSDAANGGDEDAITVQIWKGGINDANRAAVGSATSTVIINPETIEITPADHRVARGGSQQLQAVVIDRQSKGATFRWTTSGDHGYLGGIDGLKTQETPIPLVTYTARQEDGVDTIWVDVLGPTGKLRGSGGTTVHVTDQCGDLPLHEGYVCCNDETQGRSCCGDTALRLTHVCCGDHTQGRACCGQTALTSDNICCADLTQGPQCCNGTGCATWAGTWSGPVTLNCTNPFTSGLRYDITIVSETQLYIQYYFGAGNGDAYAEYSGNTAENGSTKLTLHPTAHPATIDLVDPPNCRTGTLTRQ
jgi:hypothetical protein